jgi:NTP pyrophosphatase (non-canonical NTP hydrolase)
MSYPTYDLTFQKVFRENVDRAQRWHKDHPWNPLEWAGAMCGEAGEAANAAKKLKRILDGIDNINEKARSLITIPEAQDAVIKECCDTILYALLLAHSAGSNAETFESALQHVFNKKSREYGFPEYI